MCVLSGDIRAQTWWGRILGEVTTGSEMGTDGYLASSVSFFVFFLIFQFWVSVLILSSGSLCSRLACWKSQKKEKVRKKIHQGGQIEVSHWHRSHLIILFICLFICSHHHHCHCYCLSLLLRSFRLLILFYFFFLFHHHRHRRTHPRFASSAYVSHFVSFLISSLRFIPLPFRSFIHDLIWFDSIHFSPGRHMSIIRRNTNPCLLFPSTCYCCLFPFDFSAASVSLFANSHLALRCIGVCALLCFAVKCGFLSSLSPFCL